MVLHIRKGDLVEVISGTDKGKQGRVLAVNPGRGRLRVEKVKAGRKGSRTGGIIEQEGFIDASNVMLIDPKDNRPSRVRVEERGGQRIRVFVKSGDPVPEAVRS
jgi:large subunit ribosomal protein L24